MLKIDKVLLDDISSVMTERKLTISVAESCTGGFVSTFFTSKSGASTFFKGSLIAYSNESKKKFLNIEQKFIDKYNIVSNQVVEKMAYAVRNKFNTHYGLATSGYVDPSNLVFGNKLCAWIAISDPKKVISRLILLNNNRLENISKVSYDLLYLLRKEIV